MKTQISRDGFRPDKRYSGVYQQQGRMITDRDWNELVDILKSRLDEGMADVVGDGLPRRRAVRIAKGAANSPGGLAFQPGVVYAGGVAARVAGAAGAAVPFRFDQQADFPSAPLPPAGQAYVLYADVWERPVTALEDGELRDPALNGADTTTRTRTMAQIKWAQAARDAQGTLIAWNPESPAQNPPRGNGTLTVSVPARGTGDPAGVADSAGGDFLFRVEVHDVRWAGTDASQPTELTLKWSRENGAEQHRMLEAPSSFKAGPWIYEVFQPESELHLGYHWPAAWRPVRGKLSAGFPLPDPQTDGGSLVRRWDGYCVLRRSGAAWSFSADESPARTAPGAVASLDRSASARLNVRLLDLELSLDLQDKVFLPGDSWQAPVRQAIHQPGDSLLLAAPPSGIVHRYVTLADVSPTGDVTPALPTFSALSELTAADIRYDGAGCQSGLFDASHDTAQKALDRLWQLGAQHAAYAKLADTSIYQGKTVANVRDALDLLSNVHARQILYDGRTGVPDVQTAVDELFARPNGDANGFTVGTGGEFPNLMTALQTLLAGSRRDVRLFLLPGDHVLDPASPVASPAQPVHLSLAGSGWATRLLVRRRAAFVNFASLTFQSLAIEVDPEMTIEVTNGELNFLDNRISGFSKEGLIRPVSCTRLLVRDNIAEVTVEDPMAEPTALLTPLDTEQTVRELLTTHSPRLFTVRAQALVDKLRALSPAVRAQRVFVFETNLERSSSDLPRDAYLELLANLRQGPDTGAVALLATIRRQAMERVAPGVFLQIGVPNIPTRLESNQILGTVALYGAPGSELSGTDLSNIAGRIVGGLVFDPSATADLIATGNRLSGFQVGFAMIDTLRSTRPVSPLFQRLALSDNTIDATFNQLVANSVELTGNLLTAAAFGWVVGEEALFVGNAVRTDVTVDTAVRNLVQAGNSAHLRIRPAAPVIPK
jgi:hypothetical protein